MTGTMLTPEEAKLIQLDSEPLKFGKYRGKTPIEIADINPQYIVWMYDNVENPATGQPNCSKTLRNECAGGTKRNIEVPQYTLKPAPPGSKQNIRDQFDPEFNDDIPF